MCHIEGPISIPSDSHAQSRWPKSWSSLARPARTHPANAPDKDVFGAEAWIGLAVPAGPIGPWSRRTGAPRRPDGDRTPPGPRWVRMRSGSPGSRRARAVTTGSLNPQVNAAWKPRPGTPEEADGGVESHLPQPPRSSCRTPGVIGLVVASCPSPPSFRVSLNTQRAGVPQCCDQGQPVYTGGCPWPRPRQGSP